MSYFSMHNHSYYSNPKAGLDSINRIPDMIKYANAINLAGICLSDHEILSGHYEFVETYQKMKEAGKLHDGFKIGLANEIYYVLEDSVEELKENRKSKHEDSEFYHMLLVAMNYEGHLQLRRLSTMAWESFYMDGYVKRTPTFKENIKKIINKGDVIASSACLGNLIPKSLLKRRRYEQERNYNKVAHYNKLIQEYIEFCVDVFGKDGFFLELQPSENEEQIFVNRELLKLSEQYSVPYTIATDAHYMKKDDREAHKVYLLSGNDKREVDTFYDATYIMSEEEVKEYLSSHMTENEIQKGFKTTMQIHERMEMYSLDRPIVLPLPPIPEYKFEHILKDGYEMYPYIEKFANSPHKIDNYLLHMIQQGLVEKVVNKRKATKDVFHQYLDRINLELKEIWLISEKMNERISAYYAFTADLVEHIWKDADSIVAPGRGSSSGFVINWLTDIVQISALDYNLPHFRHLTAERPELPDIDIDTQQNRRKHIIEMMNERYGRTLNICTFTKEGSRSALMAAGRGMGLEPSEINPLTSLIPQTRGFNWSLHDCFMGDGKEKKPVTELVNAVKKYPGLMEAALKIEGTVKNNSIHASGVMVFGDNMDSNALMVSNNGVPTTQFDMDHSTALGSHKIDLLTTVSTDKIRFALDEIVEQGLAEDKGGLKTNYDTYIHPDVLNYDNQEMWDKVANMEIPDLFQFETEVGGQCAKKAKPQNIEELATINNLMRLMSDNEEQPIDKFVRFKNNIDDWYREMDEYNLTKDEVKIMEDHILKNYGMSSSQEEMMRFLMDDRISGLSVKDTNFGRSVVSKKKLDKIPEFKEMFFSSGTGSHNLKRYIWETQIQPMVGYSFSDNHSIPYSSIACQQMLLSTEYPRIVWDTACLTISAQADEENESSKGADYGKIASAISRMARYGVEVGLPDINRSRYGFTPDLEHDRILYGLKGISGVGDEIVREIIANRPYATFEDFYERMYETKMVKKSHMLSLIKAGAFNSFDSQEKIMKQFLVKEVEVKETLNGQNMKRVITLGLLDEEELVQYRDYFNFREYLKKLPIERKTQKPRNRFFKVSDDYTKAFIHSNFSDDIVDEFYPDGSLIIDEKAFDKEYKKKMSPFTEGKLKDGEFVRQFNIRQFYELWNEYANGSIASWQMDSVSMYSKDVGHELANINVNAYGISNYTDLPEEPKVVDTYEWKGATRYNYELATLVGTVLDKDNHKHTITLLGHDGSVFNCKTYAGAYSHYNKEIKKNGERVEDSYFKKGTLLMVRGYRKDDRFILKAEKGNHTITLITDIKEDGTLSLQSERTRV